MKKKILILCDYFLPGFKAGGPVRSLAPLVENLKNDFDMTVVTRNHDLVTTEPYSDIQSDQVNEKFGCHILYLSEKNIIRGLCKFLNNQFYDVIYFNTYFSPKFSVLPMCLIRFNRLKADRIIISPRGELSDGALSIKPIRKKLFVRLYKYLFPFKKIEWHAASESERSELKGIWGSETVISVLSNMSSVKKASSIENNKKSNEIKIIFLSRVARKKNVLFALEVLSRVCTTVQFDIYGPIHHKDYWHECLGAIEKLPENIKVDYQGNLPYELVQKTLKQYDLFFLPTLNENYGHVVVESLAAGCPVLLSDQTPWKNLTKHNAGWVYSLSDPEKFVMQIDALAQLNNEEYLKFKQGALNYFSNHINASTLAQQYKVFFDCNNKNDLDSQSCETIN